VSTASLERQLDAMALRRRRPSGTESEKHGHRALALRAAATMEARALVAGARTTKPTAPAAAAKPPVMKKQPPVKKTKPPPPLPKTVQQQWFDEHCRWRIRTAQDDYDDDEDRRRNKTVHDYDPLDFYSDDD